jgi:hypothetical protein
MKPIYLLSTSISLALVLLASSLASCIPNEEKLDLQEQHVTAVPAPECQVQCNNTGDAWGYTINCPAERPNCVGVDLSTPCEPGERQDGFCDGSPAPTPEPSPAGDLNL